MRSIAYMYGEKYIFHYKTKLRVQLSLFIQFFMAAKVIAFTETISILNGQKS